jgi:hypothetical protein
MFLFLISADTGMLPVETGLGPIESFVQLVELLTCGADHLLSSTNEVINASNLHPWLYTRFRGTPFTNLNLRYRSTETVLVTFYL